MEKGWTVHMPDLTTTGYTCSVPKSGEYGPTHEVVGHMVSSLPQRDPPKLKAEDRDPPQHPRASRAEEHRFRGRCNASTTTTTTTTTTTHPTLEGMS